MNEKYGAEKIVFLIDETSKMIKKLDSNEIGNYFDSLYLKLDKNFEDYCFILDSATYELEHGGMTDEEIEIQDNKMISSKSKINRPRSAHELDEDEWFDMIKSGDWSIGLISRNE